MKTVEHRADAGMRRKAIAAIAGGVILIALVALAVVALPRAGVVASAASPSPWPGPSTTALTAATDGPDPTSVASMVSPAPSVADSGGSATLAPAPTGYTVDIAPDLGQRWNAAAAASAAMATIRYAERKVGEALAVPRILAVRAMAGDDVPDSFGGPFPDMPIAWLIEAEGTFSMYGAPGAPNFLSADGYMIYNDDGQQIGYGFNTGN